MFSQNYLKTLCKISVSSLGSLELYLKSVLTVHVVQQ